MAEEKEKERREAAEEKEKERREAAEEKEKVRQAEVEKQRIAVDERNREMTELV